MYFSLYLSIYLSIRPAFPPSNLSRHLLSTVPLCRGRRIMDELCRRPLRCILHLDLDCFYAQVESKRLGLPEDAPLAVQQWGGLLAINYAARTFGIKRGMRVEEARARCPTLHTPHVPLVGGDSGGGDGGSGGAAEPDRSQAKVSLERYRTESAKIFALLETLAPELERASIDEAYIDATELAAEEHARVLADPQMWARAAGGPNPNPNPNPNLNPNPDPNPNPNQAVGSFLFSPPERWRLAHGASWELLHALVETALARQRECSDMLRLEERRAAELRTADDDDDMDMGGGGGGGGGPAAERLARAQEALDAARREKKALFANLFAGACAALGAQPSVGGAPLPTWCGVTLSHMRAIGRRYVRELSIETLEMVVEGSDADTAVQAQLFEPLKQLTAYLS